MNIASLLAKKSGAPITIRPEQTVRDALAFLAKHNIGALIVVNAASTPVGIVSERDIVREAARNEQVFARAVSEIMTRDVITGVPQDDLASVANLMTEKRIRHLPVVTGGKLIGIIHSPLPNGALFWAWSAPSAIPAALAGSYGAVAALLWLLGDASARS